MKTQKIVSEWNGRRFTVKEIPATIVDIGSQFVTFVHKTENLIDKWAVSEQSTGTIVATGSTRTLAIENARNKVKEVGAENMRFAVERQLNYLKTHNVNLN